MKNVFFYFFLWACRLLMVASVEAQPACRDVVRGLPAADSALLSKSLLLAQDSAAVALCADKTVRSLVARGYAECAADTVLGDSACRRVIFHLGRCYVQQPLEGQARRHWARKKPLYEPFSFAGIAAEKARLLRPLQNKGYPFASYSRPAVAYKPMGGDSVLARVQYQLDMGAFVVVDSVEIRGRPRERDRFVAQLAHVRKGDAFNQQAIDDIPRLLNNSIYYQQVKPAQVSFLKSGNARVVITIAKRKSNRFDVLVGLLPPANPNSGQRTQFTGNVDIALVSPLRLGETLQLKFAKLPTAQSQQLNVRYMQPYLWGLPLRGEGELDILKQDSTFQTRKMQATGGYEFSPYFQARFSYKLRQTDILSTTRFRTDTANRAAYLDGARRMVVGGFAYEKLDYRLNPTRGLVASVDMGTGKNTVRRNVDTLAFPERIYKGLALEQAVREFTVTIGGYRKVSRRGVLHGQALGYYLQQGRVARNDQIPLGGARSLRGFNENQFFADRYAKFTAEYRFLLERDSYVFGFCDAAYLEDHVPGLNAAPSLAIYRPLGLGLGMQYATKAGIMSIVYAVGKAGDIGGQVARGKIHVGLVQQF